MSLPRSKYNLVGRKRGTHSKFRRLGRHKRTGKLYWSNSPNALRLRRKKLLEFVHKPHEWASIVKQAKKQGLSVKPVDASTLQERALVQARLLLGIRESGGNNRGPKVDEIIRANGGALGEPWCGDFVAYCYKRAGSKAVTRSWAAVRLLGGLAGLKKVHKRHLQPGDLVRFTFDHVGMFERYSADGESIVTIEGNTGDANVSDGQGGEGVERKTRPLSLVADGVRVTR